MTSTTETTPREQTETDAPACYVFDIGGMDCADCARTIEASVRSMPGVASAELNFGAATLRVESKPAGSTSAQVVRQVERSGYRATPKGVADATSANPHLRRMIEIGLAAILWIAAFALDHRDQAPSIAIAAQLGALAIAGYPVARAARESVRLRRADMNLLMMIAAIGAVALGDWEEGSSVLILFAIGLLLQATTLERTRRSVRSLMDKAPREATVLVGEREVKRAVDQVRPGEIAVVKPGERIPVDGVVFAGRSSVDQSPVTGECALALVEPGSAVFAGGINADGAIQIRVGRTGADTTIARIIRMIEEAQSSRAPSQAFVDRFAAVYTPVVVAGAVLMTLGGAVLSGDPREWINNALILLVVACPCALVISTPVALVTAIGAGSKRGILFKGGAALEALANVRAVAFDKTGTLTEGRPQVMDVFPFAGKSDDDVLVQAAAIEQGATHPIARGVLAAANLAGLSIPRASDHRALPGRGASAVIDDRTVYAGTRSLFHSIEPDVETCLVELERKGRTTVLVGSDRSIDGVIAFADPSRTVARRAIAELRDLNVRSMMLSGDNQRAADTIGRELGIDEARGGLLPEDKVEQIRRIQSQTPVAMIGDGINDGPALALADVGIAMSASGTDLAIETADIALANDDLLMIPAAIILSRATLRTIHQNVAAAIGVKILFLALTMFGLTNLWLAVLADTGMSVLVTLNSLRLALPDRKSA